MNNFLEKLEEKMQKVLLPLSTKLTNEPHLAALKNGMTITIALMIIGGFSMLLAVPPVPEGTTNSFLMGWKSWAAANNGLLMAPFNLTIGIISVYVAFGVTYALAKEYKIEPTSASVLSVFLFWLTSASTVGVEGLGNVSALDQLGAKGMFYAIIVSFIVCDVMKLFYKSGFKIKLPEQVPSNVSAPFESLIPAVVLTILFVLLNALCVNKTGGNLSTLIFTIIKPLMSASSSLPATLMLSMLLSFFWFFGIHGNNMISGVLTPIATANLANNANVYVTGSGTIQPLAGPFLTVFGNWMTYPAMMLCFFLVAKSASLKSLRKVALVPDLFNINEPLTFGVPVVMNLLIAVPIMIMNMINCTIAYLLISSGAMNGFSVSLPFTVPGIINIFLSSGGDLRSIIVWIGLFALSVVLLLPFVKIYDKQLLREEQVSNTTELE